jgi:DNA-binding CsgD family transcriptional regulator
MAANAEEALLMTWQRLPHIYRQIATEVCTPAELDALKLSIDGESQRSTARILGIKRSSVRDRLDNARDKIVNHPDYPKERQSA